MHDERRAADLDQRVAVEAAVVPHAHKELGKVQQRLLVPCVPGPLRRGREGASAARRHRRHCRHCHYHQRMQHRWARGGRPRTPSLVPRDGRTSMARNARSANLLRSKSAASSNSNKLMEPLPSSSLRAGGRSQQGRASTPQPDNGCTNSRANSLYTRFTSASGILSRVMSGRRGCTARSNCSFCEGGIRGRGPITTGSGRSEDASQGAIPAVCERDLFARSAPHALCSPAAPQRRGWGKWDPPTFQPVVALPTARR